MYHLHKKNVENRHSFSGYSILFQIKSTQWYKVIVRKNNQNGSCLVKWSFWSQQREEKHTETTAQREGITVQINRDTPTTQQTETQS